jgi:flap endonuclease-1
MFGAPRIVRFLTISGKEFLPSRAAFRAITPELIEAEAMLDHYKITREQLIDVAILVGTDFNEGIKGIGPKKAVKLVSQFGAIESMPAEIRDVLTPIAQPVRKIYLQPCITDDYEIKFCQPQTGEIIRFLCDEREFSRERVTAALDRAYGSRSRGLF